MCVSSPVHKFWEGHDKIKIKKMQKLDFFFHTWKIYVLNTAIYSRNCVLRLENVSKTGRVLFKLCTANTNRKTTHTLKHVKVKKISKHSERRPEGLKIELQTLAKTHVRPVEG